MTETRKQEQDRLWCPTEIIRGEPMTIHVWDARDLFYCRCGEHSRMLTSYTGANHRLPRVEGASNGE